MNSMLLKLRIAQTKSPVFVGQILVKAGNSPLPLKFNDLERQDSIAERIDAYYHDSDKLKECLDISVEDSLNFASKKAELFRVLSISRQMSKKAGKDHEIYKLAVLPVEWDKVTCDFVTSSQSPHPFDISISSEELDEHFAVYSRNTAHKAIMGDIDKAVKGFLDKFDRNLYDASVNYSQIFKSIFYKTVKALPSSVSESDREDLFAQAFTDTFDTVSLSRFKPEKGNIVAFLYSQFKFRLLDAIKDQFKVSRGEFVTDSFEPGEEDDSASALDALNLKLNKTEVEDSNPENIVSFKDMVEKFKDWIEVKYEKPEKAKILQMLFDEMSKGDFSQMALAQKLGVHKTRVHQLATMLREDLVSFAKKTDNDFLLSMLKSYNKKHASSETSEADEDLEFLSEALQKYRELFASQKSGESGKGVPTSERFPTGKTTKITKKSMPDSLDDLKKKMVLDDSKSKEAAEEEINKYLADLTTMDDLLEEDGKIIGLKVSNDG